MSSRRDVLAGLLAAAFLAGCGRETSRTAPPPPPGPVKAQPVRRAADLTTFGANVFEVVADPKKNAVVSPLSIAYAFGMLRVGARGETAAQIDSVMGFPADPHAKLRSLSDAIVTSKTIPPKSKAKRQPGDDPKPPIVAIANGLFIRRELELVKAFVDTLASEYDAEAQRVDFAAGDGERQINAWVREQTAERIDKLFDRLDPNTVLVLANAVYLKADWAVPLMQEQPQPENFRSPSGRLTVPMIGGIEARRHAAGAGWQAVELAYAGGELAMWVLVPTGDAAPATLLAPTVLAAVGKSLVEKQVSLSMPRWDFATDLNLIPPLQQLGMIAPFGAADFSGMLPGAFVSQVVHRANITVDEFGTEAAAVTGIAMELSMPAVNVRVQVDRPFAFAIMHLPTKTPLFLGQVVDPTSKG
jgi:serpin B